MFRLGIVSFLAVVVSLGIIVLSRNSMLGRESLVVLCAPSLSGPMEKLKEALANSQGGESQISIEIMYRGSAELLAMYRMSHIGDVLMAADVDYHQRVC